MGNNLSEANARAVLVQIAEGRLVPLGELLDAWTGHVVRLEQEQFCAVDAESVWGAYDYYAALLIRSRIRAALQQLPTTIVDEVVGDVTTTDQRFQSYTEPDHDGMLVELVDRAFDRSVPDDGWWWSRIPAMGPVRHDVMAFVAAARDQEKE